MDMTQIMQLANNPGLMQVLNDPKVLQQILQNPQKLQELLNSPPTPPVNQMQEPSPVKAPEQSTAVARTLAPEGMLLQLLIEFEDQDPEKKLSALLTKFSRYVQSRVNSPRET